jgi:hypothetical protein
MLPLESYFVKITENKVVYIHLYKRHHELRPRGIPEVKIFAESVARNLQLNELTIRCDFINYEWQFNFIFLPVDGMQRIYIPYAITISELCRVNALDLVSHVSRYILAKVRELVPRQTWRIDRRLIQIGNLSEYHYNVHVRDSREQRSFRARSVTVNIDEPSWIGIDSAADAGNVPSFVFAQNQWLEIEAEIVSPYCEINNYRIIIDNFLLNAYTLGYFDYSETIDFRIKPNIIADSLSINGDIITFEALPINVQQQQRSFNINHHPVARFVARENYQSFADAFRNTAVARPAIYNQTCKYFNGGDYLRCAVNPEGECKSCNDFEVKDE